MNTAEPYAELSPRQLEVVQLKSKGNTGKECAKLMGCSEQNIKGLMNEVFFKLHARNSLDAIAKAARLGILNVLMFGSVGLGLASDDEDMYRFRNTRLPRSTSVYRSNRELSV